MSLSRMTSLALLAAAVAALAGAARAGHPHGAPLVPPAAPPAAHADCGPCTQTICAREVEKKVHVKTVYRCKTRTICLPYCGGRLCGRCDAGCGECGQPRQVRVLIKRFVKEEHCSTPCKPRQVLAAPGCPAPCPLPAHGAVIHGVTQPQGK